MLDEREVAAIVASADRALREPPTGATTNFLRFLQDLQRYPLLTPAQERQLARKAFEGSQAARDALVRHNLRFVIAVARKYASHGVPLEDLTQEGAIGLMRAVVKFDPSRNVRLVTYASYWIEQAVRSALVRQQRAVRLPSNRAAQLAKLRKAATYLAEQQGRPATHAELAAATQLAPELVELLLAAGQGELRLDAPVGGDEGATPLSERLAIEDPTIAQAERAHRRDTIETALAALRPRDAVVLRLWFGLERGREHTLEEIGVILRISRERARQIRDRALGELHARGLLEPLRGEWGRTRPAGDGAA